MSSLDSLYTRSLAKQNKVGRVVDDTPVVLRLREKAGSTSTPTVVLSNTSSTLTLTDSAGTATAIDLSAAATNSVGEVADYINGLTGWECKILDALRTDLIDDKLPNGSVSSSTVEGVTVFDLKSDTSALAEYKYRVTSDRGIGKTKPKNRRVTLKSFTYYADLTAAANCVRIYEWDSVNKTETQIWQAASVDTTVTTHDLGDGITVNEGNDLIVMITGTVVDHASGYLQCQYNIE